MVTVPTLESRQPRVSPYKDEKTAGTQPSLPGAKITMASPISRRPCLAGGRWRFRCLCSRLTQQSSGASLVREQSQKSSGRQAKGNCISVGSMDCRWPHRPDCRAHSPEGPRREIRASYLQSIVTHHLFEVLLGEPVSPFCSSSLCSFVQP